MHHASHRIHPALQNLPSIIPGGRIDPTTNGVPADIQARLRKREEEAEVLRKDLIAKQKKLRDGLRLWEKLKRDSQNMGERSELSERHVKILAGEQGMGRAF